MKPLVAFNKSKPVKDWPADPLCCVDLSELKRRLSLGWSPERAISEPFEQPKKHSRFRGVSWHRGKGKWQAVIRKDGKLKMIGRYATEEEAARAYNAEAVRLLGTDAKTNRI